MIHKVWAILSALFCNKHVCLFEKHKKINCHLFGFVLFFCKTFGLYFTLLRGENAVWLPVQKKNDGYSYVFVV